MLIDTNVLIAATVNFHADHQVALRTLNSSVTSPAAPELWLYEYTHVLTRQARLGHLSFGAASQAFAKARRLVVREYGRPPFATIFEISKQRMVTGQDAVFLYWAQTLNTPLVTFDKKLRNAAPELTLAPG